MKTRSIKPEKMWTAFCFHELISHSVKIKGALLAYRVRDGQISKQNKNGYEAFVCPMELQIFGRFSTWV